MSFSAACKARTYPTAGALTRAKALCLEDEAFSRVQRPAPRTKVRGWHGLLRISPTTLLLCPKVKLQVPRLPPRHAPRHAGTGGMTR
jgi:hypothetical protein